MSRYYEMCIEIEGVKPEKEDAVIEAANGEWNFENWESLLGDETDDTSILSACGRSDLCGGESEDEFVNRVALAIWQANDDYCQVSVDATYLEELPHNSYSRDESDFYNWLEKQPAEGN